MGILRREILKREIAQELEVPPEAVWLYRTRVCNGVKKTAVRICEKGHPTEYCFDSHDDDIRRGEMTYREAAIDIRDSLEFGSTLILFDDAPQFELPWLSKADVLANVRPILISAERNEFVADMCPHRHFLDLLCVYIVEKDGASCLVTNRLAGRLDITQPELDGACRCRDENDEAIEVPIGTEEAIIVTNRRTFFEAACGFSIRVLEKLPGEIAGGGDLWIIPGSVHEAIVCSADLFVLDRIAKGMSAANACPAFTDDIFLSNCVYRYYSASGLIEAAYPEPESTERKERHESFIRCP